MLPAAAPDCRTGSDSTHILLQDTDQQGEAAHFRAVAANRQPSEQFSFTAHFPFVKLAALACRLTQVCLQALGKLKCERRVLLSGTPVQNNLDEVSTCAASFAVDRTFVTNSACRLVAKATVESHIPDAIGLSSGTLML